MPAETEAAERDLTQYLTKSTPSLEFYAEWLKDQLGYAPGAAKTKDEAFARGVYLAVSLHRDFQTSPENAQFKEEQRQAREALLEEQRAEREAEKERKAQERAEAEEAREAARAEKEAAKAAKAAEKAERGATPATRAAKAAPAAKVARPAAKSTATTTRATRPARAAAKAKAGATNEAPF